MMGRLSDDLTNALGGPKTPPELRQSLRGSLPPAADASAQARPPRAICRAVATYASQAGWPGLPRPKGQDKLLRARVRVTRKTGIGSTRLWQAELSLEVQWTRSRANIAPPAASSAASSAANRSRVGTNFGLCTARIARRCCAWCARGDRRKRPDGVGLFDLNLVKADRRR